VVDDTASVYNQDAATTGTEPQVEEELRLHYNISLAYPRGLLGTDGQPLFGDLVRIFQSLHVVENNAPGSIGGGGKTRVPMAAPLCSDQVPFTPLKLKTDDSPQPSLWLASAARVQSQ
jgi:hypothetical protein